MLGHPEFEIWFFWKKFWKYRVKLKGIERLKKDQIHLFIFFG